MHDGKDMRRKVSIQGLQFRGLTFKATGTVTRPESEGYYSTHSSRLEVLTPCFEQTLRDHL